MTETETRHCQNCERLTAAMREAAAILAAQRNENTNAAVRLFRALRAEEVLREAVRDDAA